MNKYFLFLILLLSTPAPAQEPPPLPSAEFEGQADREARDGSSQRVLAQFHLAPPNALLQISTTTCREEELYFWQSCRDTFTNTSRAWALQRREPSAEERERLKLGPFSAAADLVELNERKVEGTFFLNRIDAPAAGGTLEIISADGPLFTLPMHYRGR